MEADCRCVKTQLSENKHLPILWLVWLTLAELLYQRCYVITTTNVCHLEQCRQLFMTVTRCSDTHFNFQQDYVLIGSLNISLFFWEVQFSNEIMKYFLRKYFSPGIFWVILIVVFHWGRGRIGITYKFLFSWYIWDQEFNTLRNRSDCRSNVRVLYLVSCIYSYFLDVCECEV